ncbi:hypothetical protein Thena_0706 [Thermodesulfobium narugense DSM 14796]|uniref:Uncharacterized protein n=1 Tax=Thermodesulfobium narugense DSM 14796 TaxID=747365 RepID=M1E5M1_9BACT|nr:hypothetical protein [Thermodesulfobium narugense]AEE14341.1 hypothetical protein Thena_0706 [Thermodesulfobium narugense DSM 14796]
MKEDTTIYQCEPSKSSEVHVKKKTITYLSDETTLKSVIFYNSNELSKKAGILLFSDWMGVGN